MRIVMPGLNNTVRNNAIGRAEAVESQASVARNFKMASLETVHDQGESASSQQPRISTSRAFTFKTGQ